MMRTETHIPFSAVFLQGYTLFSHDALHPAMFATAALTSLLPDIDTPRSEAGRLIRPVASFLEVMFGHRTVTHSIIGTVLLALILRPLIHLPLNIPLYHAAILGFLSHLVLDMSNKEGIEFTWPLRYRWVFPKSEKYRLAVGSPSERTLKIVCIGLAVALFLLHLIGPRSILHRILATPSAGSTEYYQQLLRDHRVEAEISGIWTKSQTVVENRSFEIIAADSFAVYVRRKEEATKVYCVSETAISSISHARIKVKKRGRATQQVFSVSFSNDRWDKTLVLRFPQALVSGRIQTTDDLSAAPAQAKPPTFDIDEYPTIRPEGENWELVHTPIELLNQALTSHRISGRIHVRYWED
jgi:membrane-bound metal-dependent hydrolase YbcI (DUF457 family)